MLILTDDAGFGNPGTFGGPIRTLALDRLAAGGLKYNGFHVTASRRTSVRSAYSLSTRN